MKLLSVDPAELRPLAAGLALHFEFGPPLCGRGATAKLLRINPLACFGAACLRFVYDNFEIAPLSAVKPCGLKTSALKKYKPAALPGRTQDDASVLCGISRGKSAPAEI